MGVILSLLVTGRASKSLHTRTRGALCAHYTTFEEIVLQNLENLRNPCIAAIERGYWFVLYCTALKELRVYMMEEKLICGEIKVN